MRSLAVALFLCGVPVYGQDAATRASQASVQASQQATQQANEQMQQASQQASQQIMQASQQGLNNQSCLASRPRFSLKPGAYTGTQTVYIDAKDRHSTIFYTTDGWTPTDQSIRYTGPVTLDATTHMQAVVFAPGCARSQVAQAVYTFPGTPAVLPVVVGADGVLHRGTELHLSFVTPVSSDKARIGDVVPLSLATPLSVGGRVIAPGSLHATAVVTGVHRPAPIGEPGDVTFALRSITVDGVSVPLNGEETAEGADKIDQLRRWIFIPGVNVVAAFSTRGENAEIAAGTSVTAKVAADTALPASVAQSARQ